MNKITLTIISFLFSIAIIAQPRISSQPLPIDPNVKYGKLENGMTYYIRHNKLPEKRADFYIAQRVGSMQEEDHQAGLAHFLEHMAFNGTKHFPGRKTMLSYLETIGAKFGNNVNAYTSFDETVYTLSDIPVIREGIIDSTLLVLHDWSNFIELKNEEIDKERPIIKEEWRTRGNSSMRLWEKQLPIIFKGSKYADRTPIGKMSVVENFEYQTIKDYYKKWYRPDLQSIIVVGDINADSVEVKIKELFSKIPKAENPAERIYFPVPDNDQPLVSIATDKEETTSTITYHIKHDPLPENIKQTEQGYSTQLILNLATQMLGERFLEISQTAESPFTASHTYDEEYYSAKTKNTWSSIALSKEGKEKESLAALIRETERAKQFGFTDSELERAKTNLLSSLEQVYNNRETLYNDSYMQEYVSSFVNGEAIPGIEYEYALVQRLLPTITSNIINAVVNNLLTHSNNVVTITAPEKESLQLPSEAEVLAIIKSVQAEDIDGYMEELITEPLIDKLPEAGTIEKEEFDEKLGATIWTLSNGMKVAIKETDFKKDEIIMNSNSFGGMSLVHDLNVYEASFVNYVPYLGGLGNFSANDIKKVLAGKNATVNVSMNQWTQGFTGYSSIKDLETMLQLTYLSFTAPRQDENMFSNLKNIALSQLHNLESDPSNKFSDAITFANYGDNIRFRPMKAANIDNLSYDKIMELYKQAFANPGSFIFTFVGNVDKETLKPLVELYLASLPEGNRNANYKQTNVDYRKGLYKSMFEEKMVNPQTKVYSMYSGKLEYNRKNAVYLTALEQILEMVYTETIRETEGGTYGVSVGTDITRIPVGNTTLAMSFDTNPEKASKLIEVMHAELQKIITEGVDDAKFNKVKEYLLKQYDQDIKQNGMWSQIITSSLLYNDNTFSESLPIMQNMTKENVQAVAKQLVDQKNKIEVIMNPLQ